MGWLAVNKEIFVYTFIYLKIYTKKIKITILKTKSLAKVASDKHLAVTPLYIFFFLNFFNRNDHSFCPIQSCRMKCSLLNY